MLCKLFPVEFRHANLLQLGLIGSLSALLCDMPARPVADRMVHEVGFTVYEIELIAVDLDNQHNLPVIPALRRKSHDDECALPEFFRGKLLSAALRLDPFTEMKRQQSVLVQRFCDFRAGSPVFFAEVRQPLDQLLSRVDAEALDGIEIADGEVQFCNIHLTNHVLSCKI